MKIVSCRVNHMDAPLGFDLGCPAFSWKVADAEGCRAEASRIEVFAGTECVADTGWGDLDALGTTVEGLDLLPRTRYAWRVSVRSDRGEEAVSELASFETGKMDEAWAGRWLTCEEGDRHPVFCRRIELGCSASHVVSARLYACGLGLYVPMIDGVAVSPERLAPGTNAYDRWLQAQAYDVTDLVADGAELELALGNGWYKGRFGFGGRGAYYGDSWLALAELRVRLDDGSEMVLGTDGSWNVKRSNITFSNIYDGELRDDTLPAVEPVAATLVAEDEAASLFARLRDRLSLPVCGHEEFGDCALVPTASGDTVLDLGQNIAGGFSLRVHEPRGTRVRLQFGEVLQDGEFYRDNLRSARAEYVYVSDGAEHVLEPLFTYYGYRYVKIEGAQGFAPADFTGVALYSDFNAERGKLTTGNELVNQLVENVRWGMRGNFVDTATDCPQRDERMGWTGDAQVFSNTALYLGDPYAFYRKYLFDMASEQRSREGRVPGVVPSFGVEVTGAVWGDATTFIPWNMYQMDGDASILREHFDAMCAWVDWIEQQDGDDRSWGAAFQFGDWLALDGRKTNDRLGATDEGLIAYLYWWKSAKIVAEAARVIGREDAAARYGAMEASLRAYIEGEYYSASGRCAVNTQTAYALSIVFGFGDSVRSGAELSRAIQENDGKLCTGFVGTPMLCPALSATGRSKEAYDLLLNRDYPGWLFEVLHGATTVWERWNSLDENGKITGIDMNSLNHYAYGAVVEWLFTHAAGFRPLEPGFGRALIAPETSYRLGHLDMTYGSAAGDWRVAWSVAGERRLKLEVAVPFGATAEVALPLADPKTAEALATASGVQANSEGRLVLMAGSYTFEYDTVEPVRWVPCVEWSVEKLLSTRPTELVLRSYSKHPEMLTSIQRKQSIKEAANLLNLTEEKLAALDKDLQALAEN